MPMKTRLAAGAMALAVLSSAPAFATDAADTVARNKATARAKFEQVLGRRDYALAYRIHTPDARIHSGSATGTLERDVAGTRGWQSFAPDYRVEVLDVIGEGDRVAVRWLFAGTNTGEGNGLPATGKPFSMTGQTIFRFTPDGLIAEEWSNVDGLGMGMQIGVVSIAGRAQQ